MSVVCQDRLREIADLVRADSYWVDPTAVAEAIVRRMEYLDLPADLIGSAPIAVRASRPPRLRGVVRVRRLSSGPSWPPAAQR